MIVINYLQLGRKWLTTRSGILVIVLLASITGICFATAVSSSGSHAAQDTAAKKPKTEKVKITSVPQPSASTAPAQPTESKPTDTPVGSSGSSGSLSPASVSTGPSYNPYLQPHDMVVTSVSTDANRYCTDDGYISVSAQNNLAIFQYSNNPGGTISWQFEFSGDTANLSGASSTVYSEQVPANRSQFYVANSAPPGTYFNVHGITQGFQYRLHILSPQNVASGWVSIAGC